MEKQLSILFDTSRNPAISESISDLISRKDLSAIAMPTSPELGTSNSSQVPKVDLNFSNGSNRLTY